MKLISFKSIRTNLTFWFLTLTLLPLIIVLVITYFQRVEFIENRTIDKLVAIRDLKVEQLNMWLDERVSDMNTLSIDYELSKIKHLTSGSSTDSRNIALKRKISEYLNEYVNIHKVYNEVFIINPANGKVLISVNKNQEGNDKSSNEYFTTPLVNGKLFIKNIHYAHDISDYTMTYSIPVFDIEEGRRQIVGILVARVNLSTSLYRLLLDRVGLGSTGETLIVNEDVYALNKLRWYDDAPLQLQIVAEPAVRASRGETGIIKSSDYRGEEVLAAYTFIPGVNWGFVCKQDLNELNSPINELIINFIIIFFIASVIISISAINISRSITKNIIALNVVAKKMRGGDFSVRNKINSPDELGSLAVEFNNMANITESRIAVQQGISRISKTMIGKSSLEDFASALLKTLSEITEANICAFYKLNEKEKQFEHFSSIGGNKKTLESFSSEYPEGDFGNAIKSKKIYYIKNIPENTVFKYKTITGIATPNEIITIPIIVEDSVVAVISIAKLGKISSDSFDILNQSWDSINISYSNLMAGERTRVFAEHLSQINNQLEFKSNELENQTKEMRLQAEKLQVASKELKLQNIELEDQKKRVVTANQLKSEFLSNMSHELRTPLNSIMALSNILINKKNTGLNDEELNYLQIIERNGKRLLNLINDILDLSKIEAGKMEVKPALTSVYQLMNTIRDNMISLAENKGLSLHIDVPDQTPQVETDESRLYQVMVNIVGNAIKFTEKGSVDILVDFDLTNVYINIKDSGIGISPDVIPFIFDEFRQADGTSSRQYEGTGLGLAIAKKMMNILGGDITVESCLDVGSTFTISLPILWYQEFDTKDKNIQITNKISTNNPVLVIDDDQKSINIISNYLMEAGYDVLTATNGIDALNIAEQYIPFAITLDIFMPDMDGWEILQKLKSNEATVNIPVIIVTISNERQTGLALGAIGFINKPIEKEHLLNELNKISVTPNTIMIVDDNENDIIQMQSVFMKENLTTTIARNEEECFKIINRALPSVIVLNLLMAGTNGLEILSRLRNELNTKEVPVIIITPKDLSDKDKHLLQDNVTSVIAKSETSTKELCREIKRILDKLSRSKSGENITVEKSYSVPGTNKHVNILIIEDNSDSMATMKAILKDIYKITEAKDGEEGLNKAVNNNPDLILLDMSLPKLSGQEVIEELRNNSNTVNTPVIAVTAMAMIGDRERIIKLGCNEYVSKPVDKQELLNKISECLNTWN